MRSLVRGALLVAACLQSGFTYAAQQGVPSSQIGNSVRSASRTDCQLITVAGTADGKHFVLLCGKDGAPLGRGRSAELYYSASLERYLVVVEAASSINVLLAWPRPSGVVPIVENMNNDIALAAVGHGVDIGLQATIDGTMFAASNTITITPTSTGGRKFEAVRLELVADGITTHVLRR